MRHFKEKYIEKYLHDDYSITKIKSFLYFIEFLCVLTSVALTYYMVQFITNYFNHPWDFHPTQFFAFNILIIISWFASSQVSSMAKLPRADRYLTYFFSYIRISFVVFLVLILLKYIMQFSNIPLLYIFLYVPVSMFLIIALKFFTTRILRVYRSFGHNIRQVMVIADENSIANLKRLIHQKEWGYHVKYIVSDSEKVYQLFGGQIQILKDYRDLKVILDYHVVDEVIYSKKDIYENELKAIMYVCREVGVIFRMQSLLSPVNTVSLQLRTLNEENLSLVDIPSSRFDLILKTMADFYFSLTALIILSPVFIIISIIIKLESQGPVFFMQERVGLRGRKFKLYKFRSMVINASELLENLKAKNEMDGPTFKMTNDPRITRFGRFMRKTGLDELPQLINVIVGEMSLIGPRPPLESEVKQYERWQLRRLSVKPGITCTWQISPNRNDIKFEKWMQLDLNYIDNWSLSTDIQLFFKTITTFFNPSGR
jgi:exopolysaccharide biosynthesis polyprenyl glycosylphosphotransferase